MACGIASLGLHVVKEGDFKIFKLILVSKAIGSAIVLVGNETGLFIPIEDPASEER